MGKGAQPRAHHQNAMLRHEIWWARFAELTLRLHQTERAGFPGNVTWKHVLMLDGRNFDAARRSQDASTTASFDVQCNDSPRRVFAFIALRAAGQGARSAFKSYTLHPGTVSPAARQIACSIEANSVMHSSSSQIGHPPA